MALERRRIGEEVYALVSPSLERSGFLAAFTERTGGVSPSPFDTLNCSLATDDDPANGRQNRARVIEGLGIPPFACPYQVHGGGVVRVGEEARGAGYEDPATRVPETDGLFTISTGLPVAVLTADCLPIVLASPREGIVAAVHAGWRGLAAGILARAVGVFEQPEEVRAVIGPAVGPDHYEVGQDVALAVAAASDAGAATTRRGRATHLNLPESARAALEAVGVGRIEVAEVCTACEPTRFFSHRREGRTGRQLAVAMRM